MTLLFIGTQELLIIGLIILLLFGASRIPALMRSLGRGVKDFKEGMEGKPADEASQTKSDSKENKDAQ
ncbi:MAG: twin-arginine translocase TatA/TatE family subunit [Bacteroidales bacterium]|nr:twin-arginine translocase TatA/TatE family subunit [Bacteroidales bacterium]